METEQVERVENELAETLCEIFPLSEPATEEVRSKSHVNEIDGLSEAKKREKHAIWLSLVVTWDGSICCDPVQNSSWG